MIAEPAAAQTTAPSLETRPSTPQQLQAATAQLQDRVEIIDALYRFAAGQDLRDPALFASAFAAHAELDFVQPAKRLGVDLPVFKGRDNIVSSIVAALAQIDTTHSVTNPRVEIRGDQASLLALVEAQHLPAADHSRNLLLKNIFRLTLERAGLRWVITHMRIENQWYRGDPKVLFP